MHQPLQNGMGTERVDSSAFIEAHAPWRHTQGYPLKRKMLTMTYIST